MIPVNLEDKLSGNPPGCRNPACRNPASHWIYKNSLLDHYIGKAFKALVSKDLDDSWHPYMYFCSKDCLEKIIIYGIMEGKIPLSFATKIKQLDNIAEAIKTKATRKKS